jgi:hypothetical protein
VGGDDESLQAERRRSAQAAVAMRVKVRERERGMMNSPGSSGTWGGLDSAVLTYFVAIK